MATAVAAVALEACVIVVDDQRDGMRCIALSRESGGQCGVVQHLPSIGWLVLHTSCCFVNTFAALEPFRGCSSRHSLEGSCTGISARVLSTFKSSFVGSQSFAAEEPSRTILVYCAVLLPCPVGGQPRLEFWYVCVCVCVRVCVCARCDLTQTVPFLARGKKLRMMIQALAHIQYPIREIPAQLRVYS
jgi:hypothetical protein